ncbi:MAG: hypothetical protein EBU90_09220 [Proteobacteria bacterium]|nr:hypothetical protein [Pseudomonadota bacterium]
MSCNKVTIDSKQYDPYYILDVTCDDTDSVILKSYKKKVKKYHPDKAHDATKKKKYEFFFKIIVECYQFIKQKRESVRPVKRNLNHKSTRHIDPKDSENRENGKDDRENGKNNRDHLKDRENRKDPKDREDLEPIFRQFDNDTFTKEDFNKLFEYTRKKAQCETGSQLIHKTTDGFYGYNASDIGNWSLVHSYNGLLVSGDFGKSGSFSDYKQAYNVSKNPKTKIVVPSDFKTEQCTKKITFEDYKNSLRQKSQTQKTTLAQEGVYLYNKKVAAIQEQAKNDKNIVMQFEDCFDRETFNQAMNGTLDMSPSLIRNLQLLK